MTVAEKPTESDFMLRHGLRRSTAWGQCAHLLLSGRSPHHGLMTDGITDGLCRIPRADDVSVYWQPFTRRHVLVSQPYGHTPELVEQVNLYVSFWGLEVIEFATETSWHNPGGTMGTVLIAVAAVPGKRSVP